MSERVGPFRLLSVAGRGGQGEVWRAEDATSGLPVAVKRLAPSAVDVLPEIRAAAAVEHPNLVRVLDHGRASDGDAWPAGTPWLAMEWADGGTVKAHQGKADWTRVRAWLLQTLDALAWLHAWGLVHRDVKPSNLLLDAGGSARLADFGLAAGGDRLAARAGSGTPAYMAPEQWTAGWPQHGSPTDLYALGGTAWSLVCGRPPFGEDDDPARLRDAHTSWPLPVFSPAKPVPTGLESWLRTLLRKHPDARPACAADARSGLEALGPPDRATLRPSVVPPAELGATASGDTWSDPIHAAALTPPVKQVAPPPPPSAIPTDRPALPESPVVPMVGAADRLLDVRTPPLLGRDAELDVLWDALVDCQQAGRAAVVTVCGPFGSGRTALVRTFTRLAEASGAAWGLHVSLPSPRSLEDLVQAVQSLAVRRGVVVALDDVDRAPRFAAELVGRLDEVDASVLTVTTSNQTSADVGPLARLPGHLERALSAVCGLSPQAAARLASHGDHLPGPAFTALAQLMKDARLVLRPAGLDFDGTLVTGPPEPDAPDLLVAQAWEALMSGASRAEVRSVYERWRALGVGPTPRMELVRVTSEVLSGGGLEQATADLRTLLDTTQDPDVVGRAAALLAALRVGHQRMEEALAICDAALARTDIRPRTRARILAVSTRVAFRVPDTDRALRDAREGLALRRAHGTPYEVVDACCALAQVQMERSDLEGMRATLEQAEAWVRDRAPEWASALRMEQGSYATAMADWPTARLRYRQALLAKRIDGESPARWPLPQLAFVQLASADPARALDTARRGERAARDAGFLARVQLCALMRAVAGAELGLVEEVLAGLSGAEGDPSNPEASVFLDFRGRQLVEWGQTACMALNRPDLAERFVALAAAG